ncbi:MAG: ACT domain-containing protein [Syntrophales bacterium]|nr:ACT domain-containing protein [Syntrophales bacterium]MDD5533730.1 ACT domain-containing protein [Syntrophales bacterium]
MAKAFKAKQINFMMPNRVGLLAEISAALAEAGVNIEALCAYEWEEKGAFMVIADNTAKAKRIISGMGAEDLETEDVIALEVPNRVGELRKASQKIADAGIDIYYLYTSPSKAKTATLIFKTDNDRKALKALS